MDKKLIPITKEQYDFAMKYISDPIYRDKMIYPCSCCESETDDGGCDINCNLMRKYEQDVKEAEEKGVDNLVKQFRIYADLCRKKFDIEDQMEEQAQIIDSTFDICCDE